MPKRSAPAYDPETRQQQLIAKAEREAERLIDEHQATSQLLVHYLKLGTERERLNNEKLKAENDLLRSRITQIENETKSSQVYAEAIEAFRKYSGAVDDDEDDDDYDYDDRYDGYDEY